MKQTGAENRYGVKQTGPENQSGMKQTGSNLVTKAGIVLLALVLLAAAYFRVDTLVGVAAAFLMISVIAYLWAYFSLSRISLCGGQPAAEGFPGEELTIHACVKNEKLLPVIWLRLKMPEAPEGGFCVRPLQADGTLQTFLWVMPYQEIEWEMTFQAVRRGVFAPEALRVCGGDGFGLAEQERDLRPNVPFELVVFPQIMPVDTAPLRRYVQAFETSQKGIYEDHTLLRHTRSYQYGDPVKAINWRQTARSGRTIVNLYEKQQVRHIALGIDTESFAYTQYVEKDGQKRPVRRVREAPFEEAVSVLASAAMDLLDHGLCVTLYLPQGRSEPTAPAVVRNEAQKYWSEQIRSQEGERIRAYGLHRVTAQDVRGGRALLRELSYLDPLTQKVPLPEEEMLSAAHTDGPLFLFTRCADERVLVWLEEYRHAGVHVIAGEVPGRRAGGEDGRDAGEECDGRDAFYADGNDSGAADPAVWSMGMLRG